MAERVVERVDESLKADIMHWATFYVSFFREFTVTDGLGLTPHTFGKETRMRTGNKKIFHLEAWVVKVMSLYKVRFTSSLTLWIKLIDGHTQHFLYNIDMSSFE